jgi:hypothetical protein
LFPEQGALETRTLTFFQKKNGIPAGEYALIESYCIDPECDCQRVMLNVLPRYGEKFVASISYGFDREDEFAGPLLDPLNRQSSYANALLALVRDVILLDKGYVARLKRHYRQVKATVAHPSPAVRAILEQYRDDADDLPLPPSRPRRIARRPKR